MRGSGWLYTIVGAVLLAAAVWSGLADAWSQIALVAGAILLIVGIIGILRARDTGGDEEMQRPLADKVLLRSLARMASSDTNVKAIEVDTICRIYKETTGEEVSAAEVRTLSSGELYEGKPFDLWLRETAGKLGEEDRRRIVRALCDVIKADGRNSPFEVDFFNKAAGSLKLSAADLANICPDETPPATSP